MEGRKSGSTPGSPLRVNDALPISARVSGKIQFSILCLSRFNNAWVAVEEFRWIADGGGSRTTALILGHSYIPKPGQLVQCNIWKARHDHGNMMGWKADLLLMVSRRTCGWRAPPLQSR